MKRKNIFHALAVTTCLLASGTALAALEASSYPRLEILSGPDGNYGVVDRVERGETVHIEGCLQARNWCRVNSPDGITGWVPTSQLAGFYDRDQVSLTADVPGNVPTLTFSGAAPDREGRLMRRDTRSRSDEGNGFWWWQ